MKRVAKSPRRDAGPRLRLVAAGPSRPPLSAACLLVSPVSRLRAVSRQKRHQGPSDGVKPLGGLPPRRPRTERRDGALEPGHRRLGTGPGGVPAASRLSHLPSSPEASAHRERQHRRCCRRAPVVPSRPLSSRRPSSWPCHFTARVGLLRPSSTLPDPVVPAHSADEPTGPVELRASPPLLPSTPLFLASPPIQLFFSLIYYSQEQSSWHP